MLGPGKAVVRLQKRAWTRPIALVDLPSPRGVGVIPTTPTYFPDCREVLSVPMALGDGGIFATEKRADWGANDITPAQDDGMLTGELKAGRVDQSDDPGGGARVKEWLGAPGAEQSEVVRMEAVDILLGRA